MGLKTNELLSDLSPGEADEDRLLQIAKLAETGLSIAAVVHEIRQPLAALKMAVQLARDNSSDRTEVEAYLRDALQQTGRLEELVERTRDFLRPGEEPTEVELCEVADTVAHLIGWQLERQGTKLELVLEERLGQIRIRRAYLEQLIFNLLQNARDAAVGDDGRVLLIVRGGGLERVELIVADNGGGIDPAVRERIFEPFFTTKDRGSGTGLGLYIVSRIVAQSGAQIALLDEREIAALDQGKLSTAFRISFPVGARDTKRPSAPPRGRSGGRTRRALVVDDEEVIRRLLSRLIEGEGFECVTTENGEDALQRLEEGGFDLLITDKNLPGISGIELVRFARSWDPAMPVMVITGYASEDSAVEAVSLGVADYVVKPIDVIDFRERIRKTLRYGTGEHRVIDAAAQGAGASGAAKSRPPRKGRAGLTDRTARGNAPGDGARPANQRGQREPAVGRTTKVAVAVLLVEPDDARREMIAETLGALGCEVGAFATVDQAVTGAQGGKFEVILAGPAVLRERREALMEAVGPSLLGSITIMERAGVDKAIEAIHLGARGVIAPPFEPRKITFEFKRSVERLLAEKG